MPDRNFPQTLVDVIGHEQILRFLAQSVTGGTLAHAYLFSGPSLVGKGQTALWLAQCANCLAPQPRTGPCGQCSVCIKVAKRSQLDTKELYPEGKSRMIRVDAIRSLAAESVLMPVEARRKFIIIHEAERMNESACNALLKTLEEPSPSVIIVLLASNPHALAPTIISRCQRVRFLPVEADKIIQFLVSRHGLAQAQAETLAALCGGRPGQALRFLNDRGLLDMREKTFKVLEGLPQMSLPKALDEAAVLESITKDGETREKVETVLEFFLTWYRDLVGVREGLPASFLINRDREEALHRKSQQFTRRSLDRGLSAILESRKGLDWNVNARLMFQNLMIQLIEDPSTGAAS